MSLPDGILIGVMPPAGDFLYEQKVTKNSLRTNGSKNSLVCYQDRMVRDALFCKLVRVTPVDVSCFV